MSFHSCLTESSALLLYVWWLIEGRIKTVGSCFCLSFQGVVSLLDREDLKLAAMTAHASQISVS